MASIALTTFRGIRGAPCRGVSGVVFIVLSIFVFMHLLVAEGVWSVIQITDLHA